jgi:hypothetical protein
MSCIPRYKEFKTKLRKVYCFPVVDSMDPGRKMNTPRFLST